jgi:hypothetical protein
MTHVVVNGCRRMRFCIIAQAASCQKVSGISIPILFPAMDRDAGSLSDVPGAAPCRSLPRRRRNYLIFLRLGPACGAEGRKFESCRARHSFAGLRDSSIRDSDFGDA